MHNSTLKMVALVIAGVVVLGFATPSLAGGATSAATKKSANVYAAPTGGVEFSSAARTWTAPRSLRGR
jgi:hypothetical protein